MSKPLSINIYTAILNVCIYHVFEPVLIIQTLKVKIFLRCKLWLCLRYFQITSTYHTHIYIYLYYNYLQITIYLT